jgi:LPS-assembly protein
VSRRHEVYGYGGWDRFRLSGRYLYAQALGGTDIVEAREQVQGGAAYYVTPEWRVRSGATQDLGYESGLRQAYVGIDYFGQCLFLSLTGVRNLTSVSSGESETEVMFRIGLKNMGGFETSGYRGSDL